MLIDARDLESGARFDADICIVGTGPAGLTLARELLGSGLRSVVLEGGSLECDDETQSLAGGETTGEPVHALDTTRARRFGGTSTLWDTRWDPETIGFRGAPLDPIDFEQREWVPHSGWPFDRAHLEPWYRRAHEAVGMGRYDYEPSSWVSEDAPQLALSGGAFETGIWLFGAQRTLLSEWRERLERAADVKVVLNANVVELETSDDGGTVTGVRAVCLPDKPLSVTARAYVTATGGIENARLLLLSNRVNASGLGNERGVVGRYFTEHQLVRAGYLTPASPELLDRLALYDERHVRGMPVMGKLRVSEAGMRRERLLNMAIAMVPQHRLTHRFRWDSMNAFSEVARDLAHLRRPAGLGAAVAEIARGWDFVAARIARKLTGDRLFRYWGEDTPTLINGGGWSTLPDKAARFHFLDMFMHVEQAPHADNRVTLSDQRDRLGCRMARVHWEWRPVDIDSVTRTLKLLQGELAASGVGHLDIHECNGRPALMYAGMHHHMGTTRMHPDPGQGVVDEHCRVHGVSNLFMAGCSVFPTGGYINPTLTIMALATRLGDRLKQIVR